MLAIGVRIGVIRAGFHAELVGHYSAQCSPELRYSVLTISLTIFGHFGNAFLNDFLLCGVD